MSSVGEKLSGGKLSFVLLHVFVRLHEFTHIHVRLNFESGENLSTHLSQELI